MDTYTSPSGLVQKYGYDSAHHLTSITDNATGAKLWEAKTYNAQGLIATESGVGGRQTTYTYDQAGRPLTISNNLASFTYTYNGGGQLTKRVENFGTTGLTETFAYDAGGCLTSSTLQGKTPVTVSYNSGRGITNKSDVGTYSYASNGAPLATVSPVSGYNPSTQNITYNSSDLPASITQGGYTRTYTYDVNDQRDYSVLTKSNSTLPFAAGKRYYFGDFERNINTENNVVTDIDYIFADGRLVALVKTTGGTKTTYGAMTDRQGSLRALYNGSGLVQSFSYDAWGNRRNPSTGAALTTSELVAANSITARGYTCHEHMDEFGLINMNARIYDPALGMFISVDPLAQEYYNTYPYAYCGGDPVNAVDPTGEMKVIYNPDGTYKETTHNNWFHNTFMDREIYIDYGDRMVRVSEEEFWQWQETGQWGSIKEADKLTQFEFWLDKPSDNIVDNVIKFFASEAYSFFNSPMVTFTGRTLGGTYQTPSERMENFIGIIEMLPITKSLKLTHPGTSKQFYKNHGVNYFSLKKYKQEVNKYKINNKNKDAFNWIYNYYITPFNETKEE